MASQEPPAYQNTEFVYEDKPNLATLLSGGIFLGLAVYFIAGLTLGAFGVEIAIIQWIMALFPVIISLRMGTTANVTIKIDIKTGFVVAKNKSYTYEAYAHEPEIFMVLEKTSTANGKSYKDYKLSLKADDETTFDIPLDPSQAAKAIDVIEKAKKAVPI
ncbi:MAG: hypothetical protein ACXAE3_17065 [Candidatus Kariarchaeaceae archaeon]|jgi:hypothetical protein